MKKRDRRIRAIGLDPAKLSDDEKERVLLAWKEFPRIGAAIVRTFESFPRAVVKEAWFADVTKEIDALVVVVASEVEERRGARMKDALGGVEALLRAAVDVSSYLRPKPGER